jgi:plastocyanin
MLLVPALALVSITLGDCASRTTAPRYDSGPGGMSTGPAFNLAFPAQGHSQSFTFADAGSWGYHCVAHQSLGMTGTVVVSASATADSDTVAVGVNSLGAAAYAFTPATVTIKPGGHVRWINRSSMTMHTVTRP